MNDIAKSKIVIWYLHSSWLMVDYFTVPRVRPGEIHDSIFSDRKGDRLKSWKVLSLSNFRREC